MQVIILNLMTKRIMYHCKCDCGTERDVISGSLSKGQSKSCGCLQREWAKNGDGFRRHSMTGSRLHRIWKNMHTRCFNTNNYKYKNYGGRGITICEDWLGKDGFMNFYNWSIANGYDDSLTIDRIDVDGNYEPSNCRWATWDEQSKNKTTSRKITVNGITKTVAEWSDMIGGYRPVMYAHTDDEIIQIIKRELNNTENRTS